MGEVLEAGMMSESEAKGSTDLIDKIIAFYDDREAYEDDEMMFKNEAQGKKVEQKGQTDVAVDAEAHDEAHLYSMKMRKFFENVGFRNFAKVCLAPLAPRLVIELARGLPSWPWLHLLRKEQSFECLVTSRASARRAMPSTLLRRRAMPKSP